jgi:hypothetical protein
VALTACEEAPPPEPEAPPVHIPTAEEVKAEVVRTLDPFEALFAPDKEPLPAPVHAQALQSLRAKISEHQPGANGPEGIKMAQRQVETKLQQAQDSEFWAAVVAMADALEVLSPDTTRTARARQEAMLQLNRPKVVLRGFFNFGDDTVAQMRIRIPATGEVFESVRAEEGEEFLPAPYTLRLLNIIGDGTGVNLEYLATGDTFQAFLQRAQDRM